MKSILKLFSISFATSAWGSIPLGILNLTIVQIAATVGYMSAFQFSLGVVLVEIMYVKFTLVGLHYFDSKKINHSLFKWVTAILILLYAGFYFYKFLFHENKSNSNYMLKTVSFFMLGVIMNSLNFLQITYWLGWSFVFKQKNILQKKMTHTTTYLIGIGLGTFCVFMLFIIGGYHFKSWLNEHQSFFYLLTAIILFFIFLNILFKKYIATIFA